MPDFSRGWGDRGVGARNDYIGDSQLWGDGRGLPAEGWPGQPEEGVWQVRQLWERRTALPVLWRLDSQVGPGLARTVYLCNRLWVPSLRYLGLLPEGEYNKDTLQLYAGVIDTSKVTTPGDWLESTQAWKQFDGDFWLALDCTLCWIALFAGLHSLLDCTLCWIALSAGLHSLLDCTLLDCTLCWISLCWIALSAGLHSLLDCTLCWISLYVGLHSLRDWAHEVGTQYNRQSEKYGGWEIFQWNPSRMDISPSPNLWHSRHIFVTQTPCTELLSNCLTGRLHFYCYC